MVKHVDILVVDYRILYKEKSKQQSEGNASRLKQISSAVYN